MAPQDETDPPQGETVPATYGELADRSNRNSWRVMYVFIAVIALVFAVGIGIALVTPGD